MVSSSGYPETLVWLAIGEEGVAILDQVSMHTLEKYPYDSIVTFGGCQVSSSLKVPTPNNSPMNPYYFKG